MIHEYSLSCKLSFNYTRSLTLQIYDTCSSEPSPCPLCLPRPWNLQRVLYKRRSLPTGDITGNIYSNHSPWHSFRRPTDRPHDSPAVDRWSGIFIELITWPISPLIADDRAGWLVGWLTSYSIEREEWGNNWELSCGVWLAYFRCGLRAFLF